MIGICQGQTELSFALPLTERLIPTTGSDVAEPALRYRSLTLLKAHTVRFGPEFLATALGQRASVTNHSFARIGPFRVFTEV